MKVLAISGSLREASYNTALARGAIELAPAGVEVELYDGLAQLPPYDEDLDGEDAPIAVTDLRERIAAADALLFVTPEYNGSIPGVLKNAVDWLSRPGGQSPLNGKPLAIMGASPSMVGTARAQGDLRNIAFYNGMPVLTAQEVLIARAGEKFDKHGRLTDETTRKFLSEFLRQFSGWIRRLRTQTA